MPHEESNKRALLVGTASRYRKGVAAVLAAAGVIASSGLLHGAAQTWANAIIAAAGAAAVILLPNESAS